LSAAQQVEGGWTKLATLSADYFTKLPEVTQQALAAPIAAYREQWERAGPLVGASGKPLPHRHTYIAPTIAWAELRAGDRIVGLSLTDSDCNGPNSAAAADLYICSAILSVQSKDGYLNRLISICYAGQSDESANEVAYNKEKNVLDYRVIVPEVRTDYCSKSFEID
jgi:hypothetical protein